MRRLAAIAVLIAGAGALVVLLSGSSAQGSSTSRVDVIFDDARGLVGGQQFKIAGAHAGTIENVVVTLRFQGASRGHSGQPLHALPPGRHVHDPPGGADRGELRRLRSGHRRTLRRCRRRAASRRRSRSTSTTEPVSLLDLFNIFNLPTRQRFQVIIDELGIGTAARGSDFNEILRRANPALALARQAISILSRQKAQLATIIDATNTIAREGAGNTANVQNFLDRAAALSTLTAAHRDSLSLTINRLPALLAAAQPALAQLDVVARDGTPLLQQLDAATPYLNKVSADLGPFVAVAKPGLAALSTALKKAIPAIKATTPVVKELNAYAKRSLPGTQLFARLAANLQQRGFPENFLSVTYYIATSLSRFDSISHVLPLLLVGRAERQLRQLRHHAGGGVLGALRPAAGLQAGPRRGGFGHGCVRALSKRPESHRAARHARAGRLGTQPGTAAPAARAAAGPGPGPVSQSSQTLRNLVNYLVK